MGVVLVNGEKADQHDNAPGPRMDWKVSGMYETSKGKRCLYQSGDETCKFYVFQK